MKYYYLDGIEKKGPYTLEEILSRNLSSDTMIYREDKTNWLALSDFEELNPVETIESVDVIIPIEEVTNVDKKDTNITDEVKIKLPKHTILILLIVGSIGIAALITYFQQKNAYDEINDDVNALFKDKSSISDYSVEDNSDGTLYDVVYHAADTKDPIFKGDNFVTVNNKRIATEPYKSNSNSDNYWYIKNLQQWETFKNLKQYYIKGPYIFGGFTALKASRDDDTFSIVEFYGGDMAYKVPEKNHNDITINRPSIKSCYKLAAECLTKKDKDSTYIPGSYFNISGLRFGRYNNDFYEISQFGDRYFYLTDTITIHRENGEKNYVIDNDKITKSTSRSDYYVYDTDWIVWYKTVNNNYEIKPKKWVFFKCWGIYSIIGIIISIVVYFIVKNR
jgi:hypothetical protein